MASVIIPGIPNDLALHCLARLPLASHKHARAVCRAWRSALLANDLYQVRSREGLSEQWLYVCTFGPVWQAYDPLSQRWHSLPPLPSAVPCLAAFGVAAASRSVFVMGGESQAVNPATGEWDGVPVSSEVWAWDPRRGQWLQKASMPVAKKKFACCVVEGKIVVAGGMVADVGGSSSLKPSACVQIYDPEEDSWSYGAELRAGEGAVWGVMLQRKMHVMHPKLRKAEVFYPSQNRWTVVECGLEACPMGQVNGELYMLNSGRVFRDGETVQYAPQLDRISAGMAAVGSNLYVFGGWPSTNLAVYSHDGLNDCHIISVAEGTISEGSRMTVCKGSVLGSAVLSL
ncbi:hypothetical protein O6H91_01G074200 [Diphasiastrum complanatum]|uniref:Uncharacterized protein n=1 Tax=Diphasiastrum complanatum TaxID=34168 RepID=A0ACC2ES66_DIPCM|nr:hypothetical protein O6H91_Y097200 [Diphasiastrum complanatum]KAJ7569349.1 hypothetical protein O6H91_01G074200 [Diphasiastrum complanatum]